MNCEELPETFVGCRWAGRAMLPIDGLNHVSYHSYHSLFDIYCTYYTIFTRISVYAISCSWQSILYCVSKAWHYVCRELCENIGLYILSHNLYSIYTEFINRYLRLVISDFILFTPGIPFMHGT